MNEPRRIFAISDLHLPGGDDKSMDLFGPHWQGHFDKIRADWLRQVQADDIVLIPGDISWAMRLEDALPDLAQISDLPGFKVMIKGNHDYWWNSLTRVKEKLPHKMLVLQNDAVLINGTLICGSRGWSQPGSPGTDAQDEKIYQRELLRLELSLKAARKLDPCTRLVALCHFPPCGIRGEDTPVTALMEQYGVSDVVYGHLHGQMCGAGFSGSLNGVRYYLVSCDCAGFRLTEL